MILASTPRPLAGRVTLDDLVRHNARKTPDLVALQDAPDRPLWTEGAPRRLTWAQVDSAASAAAARLVDLGLGTDAVVAIQGPTSSDTLLAVLACLRANLIPAMLPLGWRQAEAAAALPRVGARAIFASSRAGPASPADTLRYVAAELFSIRFVCGFGKSPPDGVVPFEDCIGPVGQDDEPRSKRLGNPAEHVALVTWDCGPGGYFPVGRSHNEWISAGLCTVSELRLGQNSSLLTTLSPCTFAGLATGLVPWLMGGGTLVLHQAFDATVLGVQMERQAITHLVLPRVALDVARREGLLQCETLKCVATITRRPDSTASLPGTEIDVSELAALGETGLVPIMRSSGGIATLPLGPLTAPHGVEGSPDIAETGVSAQGVLAMRGAMVPRAAFPGPEGKAVYPVEAEGWVSTGFPASVEAGVVRVLGPRPDVVSMGGHTVSLAAIEASYSDVPDAMAVTAVAKEDAVLGERLLLEAVPKPGGDLTAASMAAHAEAKGVSPLAQATDAAVGDRRKGGRLAGAA
jgi:acyl-CoA synthetase (AMP-forming)/AMP-acid ligase II